MALANYVINVLLTKFKEELLKGTVVGGAYFEIFTAPMPPNPINAATGVQLATVTIPDESIIGPIDNQLRLSLTGLTVVISGEGKMAWFRLYNKDKTVMYDGTIGLTGSKTDLQFSRLDVLVGDNIKPSDIVIGFGCPS